MKKNKYIQILKSLLGKTNKNNLYKVRAKYARYYDAGMLQENLVIIESNEGTSISEKEYQILQTLYHIKEGKNKKYQLVVAVCLEKEKEIRSFLHQKKLYDVKIAVLHTKYYCKVLATAQYLINNNTFPSYFIKHAGQIYINTGYENSMEYIEKDKTQDLTYFGNIQRNFIMADYIICHNKENRINLENRFMLKHLFLGNYIVMEDDSGNNHAESKVDFGAPEIVDIVFEQKEDKRLIKNEPDNKENILIYGGSLLKNGITTALRGLLNHLDLDKRNYILLMNGGDAQENIELLKELDERITCILIEGKKLLTNKETIANYLYFKFNIENNYVLSKIEQIYKREVKRLFGSVCFHAAIHFSGYEKELVHLISEMDSRKIIFVHNNMNEEGRKKNRFHVPSIKYAYLTFDHIAGVRTTMKKEIEEFLSVNVDDKIKIVHNVNDIEKIIEKSKKEIVFEEGTVWTHSIEELSEILNHQGNLKFISIGRFSVEKAHGRLLDAFEKFCEKNENSYLILIGGHGPLYQATLDRVHNSVYQKRIVVIKSINNPYPILAKCDALFISSLYEGLPMTIMEALILDIPVVSVDIDGPRQFLSQGYGEIVESSVEGVLSGMEKIQGGELCYPRFDPYEFNRRALQEFESLL